MAIENEGSLIGDIIQSLIITPFISLQSNWLLAIFIISLNIFFYYILGWLIRAGFYRFGVGMGLSCSLFSIAVIVTQDLLFSIPLDLPVNNLFASLDFPIVVSVLVIFFLIGIVLWMIGQLTKKVAIKMKNRGPAVFTVCKQKKRQVFYLLLIRYSYSYTVITSILKR